MAQTDNPLLLVNLAEVLRQTTFSRAQIYRMMAQGAFPKSIKISPSRVAWRQGDIQRWLESRIAA